MKLQVSKLTIIHQDWHQWRRSGVFIVNFEACNFIKKDTLAQVLFCEFCEALKNASGGYF